MQPLGMHGRRVLNGSSVPRPACLRRKSVDGDDRRRRRFDGGCRREMSARCVKAAVSLHQNSKRIAETRSAPKLAARGARYSAVKPHDGRPTRLQYFVQKDPYIHKTLRATKETRSQAVDRLADRTASPQTI